MQSIPTDLWHSLSPSFLASLLAYLSPPLRLIPPQGPLHRPGPLGPCLTLHFPRFGHEGLPL